MSINVFLSPINSAEYNIVTRFGFKYKICVTSRVGIGLYIILVFVLDRDNNYIRFSKPRIALDCYAITIFI